MPKQLSFDEIRTLVNSALNKGRSYSTNSKPYWIADLYSSEVIYSDYDMKVYNKVSYAIASDNTVTLGEVKKVVKTTSYETVELSTDYYDLTDDTVLFSDDSTHVIREGKIFEIGEYPDKNFAISHEELTKAVDSFQPCHVDYQHIAGPLDKQLGQLDRVWIADDKKTLFGSVSMPKWLDSILPTKKVSATWDRATKTIKGLALVTNPRVIDAALMAAFAGSRHNQADMSDLQQIHDILVSHGVKCANDNAEMQGDDMPINQEELLAKITDVITKATQPLVDFGKKDKETESKFSDDPAYVEMRKQFDAMQQSLATEKARRIRDNAIAFAKQEIGANRALPAEEDSIVFQYMQSALDDETMRTEVTFAEGGTHKQGTRVQALQALFSARKPHDLTNERVKSDSGANQGIDPERKKRLRSLTPLGETITDAS